MDTKALVEIVENLFSKRGGFMSLLQEIGENFYIERADFTYQRSLGTEYGAGLMTSYPLYCRRDLGDQIGQMLRPTNKEWFHSKPDDPGRETIESRKYLEWADQVMRRAMFDPLAMFTKAAKQADHDYAAFGQMAKRVRLNRDRNGLIFVNYHLRDMAWLEDADGKLTLIARRFKSTARDITRTFKTYSPKVDQMIRENKAMDEVECFHIVVQADMWDGNAQRMPWVSIFWDKSHSFCMEEQGMRTKQYIIGRWQTVSGSQYAFSPATICALPEARLIQAMTYTLLQAGERAADPPLVATSEVLRSDVNVYAGGVTWIDRDYDERLGEALRPIMNDRGGLPFNEEMIRDSRASLMQAFFLNKLQLPQRTAEMTAYEVGQRVQEYIRSALPLFEPMEYEINGQECEEVFDLLMVNGAFGSPDAMPISLRGADIGFGFVSPLHDALDQIKGQKFLEAKSLIAEAVAMDPSVAALVDVTVALRDTLDGIGTPAKWIRTEPEVQAIQQQEAARVQAEQLLASMQQGADVAGTMAAAQKDRAEAETVAA